MKLAIVGHPIKHSLSPIMQNAALEALGIEGSYEPIDVAPQDLGRFVELARKTFDGFNITVPHKEAIIPYLDVVDQTALRSRSVNTVVNQGGCLTGMSTDGYGLQQGLLRALDISSLEGKTIGFIGTGGATQAVAHYLAMADVAHIVLVNRTIQKAHLLAEQLMEAHYKTEITADGLDHSERIAKHLAQCDVIVQSTSLGLHATDPLPIALDLLPKSALIYDMIYWETPFLKACRDARFRTCDGRDMLLYQGANAFEHWTGREAPLAVMRDALNRAIATRV